MANTKVTKAVLADDAVGLAQLDISNDPSAGQALTAAADGAGGYNLTWADNTLGSTPSFTSATISGDLTVDTSTLKVDSTNNRVGVGTTSPDFLLDVEGSNTQFKVGTASQDGGFLTSTDNNQLIASGGFYYNGTSFIATATSASGVSFDNGVISFYNNTSLTDGNAFTLNETMRINSSANVAIGTISPASKFHVKGASGAVTGVIYAQQDTTGLGKPGIGLSKYDNNTTTSQVFMMFGVDQYNAGCGQINANGTSQAAFGSFSDRRLKENITDLPSQLDNIIALQPKEFDYIESEGGGHQIGFIAQEVEEIYPDLVGERDSDNMKTLSGMGKMEARLISAIKELKTELDAAKARIETLENA